MLYILFFYKLSNQILIFLPLGTLLKVVIRNGSLLAITDPISEAQVSPLEHAMAPNKLFRNYKYILKILYSSILYT